MSSSLPQDIPLTAAIDSKLPRMPRFLVSQQTSKESWFSNLKVFLSRSPRVTETVRKPALHFVPVRKYEFRPNGLFGSIVLHGAVFALLPYLSLAFPFSHSNIDDRAPDLGKIYYRITLPSHDVKFPRILPYGLGGRAGSGTPALPLPSVGSKAYHPDLTVISRPKLPDNLKQTIIQSSSPPELRLRADVKIPNMLLGGPKAVPRPSLEFKQSNAKIPQRSKASVSAAPDLAAKSKADLLPMNNLRTENPKLPVPAAEAQQASGGETQTSIAPADNGVPIQGNGQGLIAISTEPGSDVNIALPPGNRWGDFSISPAEGSLGSPGGNTGLGPSGGGATGGGSGGDGSVGVGSGLSGGGGGMGAAAGELSIKSSSGGNAGSSFSGPGYVANPVYAVPAAMLPRKNTFVVYAGPMGGGGLNVYGALTCGKIYSVFLQMPGKPWSLQYCPVGAKSSAKPVQSTVVHMEQGLVPPDPESRYDFERLPLPFEKLHKLIVLKGIIHPDGTVGNITVYQGLLPEMDEAAKLAFSQWKFKPALRDAKPVELEILVGIPSDPPAKGPK